MVKKIFIIIVLLFAGCGTAIHTFENAQVTKRYLNTKDKKEQLLVKRFLEYWHYRANGELEKSYSYELPYQRFLTPYKKYKGLIGGYKGSKTTLVGIKFKNDTAIITRKVRFGKKELTRYDKWIFVKDNWYHKFYQTIFPPKDIEEAKFQ